MADKGNVWQQGNGGHGGQWQPPNKDSASGQAALMKKPQQREGQSGVESRGCGYSLIFPKVDCGPNAEGRIMRPAAAGQAGQPPGAPEMLQKGPGPRPQDLSKPAAQQRPAGEPQRRLVYPELDDTEFLPLRVRDLPQRGAPQPPPPPAAMQRYGVVGPAQKNQPPVAKPAADRAKLFSAAAAAPLAPTGTLRVGKDTYCVISVLQAATTKDHGMSQGVYVVLGPEKRRCVAKVLSLADDSKRKRSLAEVRALQRIKDSIRRHENINEIKDAFMPSSAPHGTLILEHCNGGSLADGIETLKRQNKGSIAEPLAFHFLYSIAKGLTMLHHGFTDHNNPTSKVPGWTTICHLDIKPANILLAHDQYPGRENMTMPRVVLADFGCSVTGADVQAGREGAVVQENGTPGWFPPESPGVVGKEMMGRYGKPTDVWQAAGVIQAMCLLLYQPDMARIAMPVGKGYGMELNCIVATCLSVDYLRRPTAMDLCRELRAVMVGKGIQV